MCVRSPTTVTDQAGKTRVSYADGLGRLSEVVESGIGVTTRYKYDVLDNLTRVCQAGMWGSAPDYTCIGGQLRSFAYDSLSRLTSATNPESGATGYTYDGNGNLLSRTDANGVANVGRLASVSNDVSTSHYLV